MLFPLFTNEHKNPTALSLATVTGISGVSEVVPFGLRILIVFNLVLLNAKGT